MDEINDRLSNDHTMIRGAILNITVDIENTIDNLIARHFCIQDERKYELINFLLPSDKISLESKRQVLELILCEHYKTKYKETYREVMRDLERRIIPKRNEFAHGKMYINDGGGVQENITDEYKFFGFLRYKKGKEVPSWYSYKEIIETIKLMESTLEKLGEIYLLKIESPPQ